MNLKSLTSLMLSSLLLFFNAAPALALDFKDIPTDHWAYKEINSLAEQNVIAGYPDESFKPENGVNRAEFTKMIIKAIDKDDMPVTAECAFTDIEPDFWAYEDILRSKELGLVVGYPDNTFQPYNYITKAEAISIVSKTIKKEQACDYADSCEYEKPCAKMIPGDCADSCEFDKPCAQDGPCPIKEVRSSEAPCELTKMHHKKCVLSQFEDNEKVAKWAIKPFKNAVKNELYVNYPDKNRLTPNKDMTRAETAALLYKLRENPSVLMAEFQGTEIEQIIEEKSLLDDEPATKLKVEEYTKVVEHLPANTYSGNVNEVEIIGSKAAILAYNVVPVSFEGGFDSKKSKEGELVNLTFAKNLETEEGTKLLPAGSKLVAQITELKKGRLFHKNGKVDLEITNLVLPSGDVYPLTATIENNELLAKKFGKCNYKRLGVVGGSITTFGSLLGLLIGACSSETGEGAALGSIIGVGTGLIVGLVSPGCSVKIPENQEIFVKLQKDLEVDVK